METGQVKLILDQTFRSEELSFKFNQSRFYNLVVQFCGSVRQLSILLEDDPELLLKAVSLQKSNSPYLPQRYRNDLNFLRRAGKVNCTTFMNNEIMKTDKECCLDAVALIGYLQLQYCKVRDLDVILEAFKQNPLFISNSYGSSALFETLEYKEWFKMENEKKLSKNASTTDSSTEIDNDYIRIPFPEKNERELALIAVRERGLNWKYFPNLALDREIVLEAVKQDGRVFQLLEKSFKNDLEIVEIALDGYPLNLQFISMELRSNKSLVMRSVTKDGFSLKFASDILRKDKEVILSSFTNNGKGVEFVHKSLWSDESIVKHAGKRTGRCLLYASESVRSNKELVLDIICKHSEAFSYLSKSLKSDRDFVLTALEKNHLIFHELGPQFKQDRSFLVDALKRNAQVFEFMQVSDRSDPNLVIIACKVTQFLTNFVDYHPRFLCNIDFALGCIKVNGESLNHFDIDEFPAEKRRELAIVAACSLFHHKSPNPLR